MADPLARAITRAEGLPPKFDQLKSQLGPLLLKYNDFPLVTLHKLEVMARIHLRSGLRLVRDPVVAHGAEIHVRALVEFMAHVAWVCGKDILQPSGTASCRAICLEIGMAQRQAALSKAIPVRYHLGKRTAASSTRRLKALVGLRVRSGCACRPRTAAAVSGTLKSVAKLAPETMDIYPWLYETASLAVHQQLYDRLLKQVGPGITDFVAADTQHRASLFTWLVHPYGVATIQILELQSVDVAIQYQAAVGRTLSQAVIRTALDGGFDKT